MRMKLTSQDYMGLYDPKQELWLEESLMLYQYDLQPQVWLPFNTASLRFQMMRQSTVILAMIHKGLEMGMSENSLCQQN